MDLEGEPDVSTLDQIPTKMEVLEMFAKLKNSIKTVITNVRLDMGHLLRRVEETEELTGKQAQEILHLKIQISSWIVLCSCV